MIPAFARAHVDHRQPTSRPQYELGWGGWWFWDPVENVSFMPWLMATALLHSAVVVEKRDSLKIWTILLAILAFSLSLIGTFIVRSGLITSVHSFASDPARGLFILLLLCLTIGGSLLLFAVRAPTLKPGGLFAPVSREGGLVLNNLLLATATATVLLGTLYPLFLEALGGGRVSVGAPFFNLTFVPLMVPLVVAMAIGPLLAWKRADLAGVLAKLKLTAAITVVVALGTLYMKQGGPVLAVFGMALAAWLFFGTLAEWAERVKLLRVPPAESLSRARRLPRSAYGMTLAHAGLAIAIAGMTASAAWKGEAVTVLRPGESVELAGYSYRLDGVEQLPGPNYTSDTATFSVTRGGRPYVVLKPEKRLYPVQNMPTTEAAIHTTALRDLYAVIGDPDGTGGWTVRIYHEPLVPWIWIGCLVMVLGGAVSLSDRRLRIGAPARRTKQAAMAKA